MTKIQAGKRSHIFPLLLFSIGLMLLPLNRAIAIPVTLDSSSTQAFTADHNLGQTTPEILLTDTDTFSGTAIPAATTLSATAGLSSSTAVINWSGDANSAIFSFDSSHAYDHSEDLFPESGDRAATFGSLIFTVDAPVTYSITGSYNATNPLAAQVGALVLLRDITTNSLLFGDESVSRLTADESFTIGASDTDGDFFNSLVGTQTGELTVGRQYEFVFNYFIQNVDNVPIGGGVSLGPSTAATAIGNATLTVSAVPIPAAIWLFGTALIGLIGFGKRRKAVKP